MKHKTCAGLALLIYCNAPVVFATAAEVPGAAFTVCYNYECSTHQTVTLNALQWQRVQALFMPPASSAAEERDRVRRAVALMETLVGTITGTSVDRGGNPYDVDKNRQMDCIDESTNTTSYLSLFQRDGLLVWHAVQLRAWRSHWLLDIHWTAVLRETVSGQRYAVDSWFLDNGQPPYTQRLEDWQAKRSFGTE